MWRNRCACVAVAVTATAAAFASGSQARVARPTDAAMSACSASYVSAHLSWGVKCLRAGEFCKVGNSQYRRYGFVCPATGHLKRT
jgi:hypothetical protein